jgi:hypothetical protein
MLFSRNTTENYPPTIDVGGAYFKVGNRLEWVKRSANNMVTPIRGVDFLNYIAIAGAENINLTPFDKCIGVYFLDEHDRTIRILGTHRISTNRYGNVGVVER